MRSLVLEGKRYFIRLGGNNKPVINNMVVAKVKPAGTWLDITNAIVRCCNPNVTPLTSQFALPVNVATAAIAGLSITALSVNGVAVSGPDTLPVPFSANKTFQVLVSKNSSTVSLTYTSTGGFTLSVVGQDGNTAFNQVMAPGTNQVVTIPNVNTSTTVAPMGSPGVNIVITL